MTEQTKRTALWITLVLGAAANAVTSMSDLNPFIGVGFGLVTLACAVALFRQHRKRHRA